MGVVRKVADLKCPRCGGKLEVFTREDYSFWPEGILEVIMSCKCGYRGTDVYPIKELPPAKYELRVSRPDQLRTRVVKSSHAVIRIPEFGIEISPGPVSQGVITNVEGVLLRVKKVLETMDKWDNPKAKAMLDKINAAMGSVPEPFTLIIEDESGASLIISEDAVKTEL